MSECPAAELAANFDFSDSRVRDNPQAVWSELRKGSPKWSDAFGGHWVAARYEDLKEVLSHPELFCSSQGTNLPPNGFPYRFPPNEADPPEHSSWRKLAAPFFTSIAMKALEPSIRTVTRDCLAKIVEQGSADLATVVAQPIPARVIAEMMGFPVEDAGWFAEISDRLLATAERPDQAEENAAAGAELVGYLAKHLEERRDDPKDDLLSNLVHGQFQGRPLTPEELLGVSFFFLIAGHETTVGGITFMLWRLGQNPQERQRLIDDRSLIPSAIEEALRIDSPVLHLARTVTEDTVLGGSAMKKGDKVMCLYAAANLDENVFPEPERFSIDRENAKQHLAFSSGIHKCQGAALGRLEMRVALEEILDVIPDYELADGVEFRSLQGVHSVLRLPVTFTPSSSSRFRREPVQESA